MIQKVTIQFPEIALQTRDAHKLRGYFGNIFKEYSPLLHNHFETGELRYRYPLVQYKVLDEIPTLVALQEGAELLVKLFLKIREIKISDNVYPIYGKNIKSEMITIGYGEELREYRFKTLWMGLNQQNFQKYALLATQEEKSKLLDKIMTGNILSFFKGLKIFLEPGQRIMAKGKFLEKKTRFKNREMLAFSGSFVVNACLPNDIGIGKAVSRGFGSIEEI